MNTLLTYDEIVALHKKYAPSDVAFDLVFTHCQIVWKLAEQLIKQSILPVNSELVKVGCLLHDIGVYRLYLPNGEIDHANYIKHGTEGYALLKEEGFDEQFCRFASCHTGVGLTKQEIEEEDLPIPPADYFAETPEEQLIMYADKFHTKTTPPKFMTADAYAEKQRRFGEEKVKRFRQFQKEFGTPELEPLAKKYGLEIIKK
jgi:HDIG domain protein